MNDIKTPDTALTVKVFDGAQPERKQDTAEQVKPEIKAEDKPVVL